jgi:hypothetical protein
MNQECTDNVSGMNWKHVGKPVDISSRFIVPLSAIIDKPLKYERGYQNLVFCFLWIQ